jgi:hypothetical protein
MSLYPRKRKLIVQRKITYRTRGAHFPPCMYNNKKPRRVPIGEKVKGTHLAVINFLLQYYKSIREKLRKTLILLWLAVT